MMQLSSEAAEEEFGAPPGAGPNHRCSPAPQPYMQPCAPTIDASLRAQAAALRTDCAPPCAPTAHRLRTSLRT